MANNYTLPPATRRLWIFWTLFGTTALVLYILHLELMILNTCKMEMKAGKNCRREDLEALVGNNTNKSELNGNQHSDNRTIPLVTELDVLEPEYLRKIRKVTGCQDIKPEFKVEYRGDFLVLKNYAISNQAPVKCHETITYTTHGDITFVEYLADVVDRWMAPISFALYTPGSDYEDAVESVLYLRACHFNSWIISEYVTFHFFFEFEHMPEKVHLNFTELEMNFTCNDIPPYIYVQKDYFYKSYKVLPYHINTARNIAIEAAVTHFIFASDIELWPSLGVVDSFLQMYAKLREESTRREVFVLPVFEVKENSTVPTNKTELQDMLKNKTAQKFHKHLYRKGHEVPEEDKWIAASEENEMKIFATTKRVGEYEIWEPFYISAKDIPQFDERLTWESRGNKLIHAYVLCLLDYDFHVLNNAFLTHRPGIKSHDENAKGRDTIAGNKLINNTIQPQLIKLYGDRKGCVVKHLYFV